MHDGHGVEETIITDIEHIEQDAFDVKPKSPTVSPAVTAGSRKSKLMQVFQSAFAVASMNGKTGNSTAGAEVGNSSSSPVLGCCTAESEVFEDK